MRPSLPWSRNGRLLVARSKGYIKRVATKKAAKRKGSKVTPILSNERHAWNEELHVMTVRLPAEAELGLRRRMMGKGDLSRIIHFALARVPRTIEIQVLRRANRGLGNGILVSIGTNTREELRLWADELGLSVNAVITGVVEKFLAMCEERPKLDAELQKYLREVRGLNS